MRSSLLCITLCSVNSFCTETKHPNRLNDVLTEIGRDPPCHCFGESCQIAGGLCQSFCFGQFKDKNRGMPMNNFTKANLKKVPGLTLQPPAILRTRGSSPSNRRLWNRPVPSGCCAKHKTSQNYLSIFDVLCLFVRQPLSINPLFHWLPHRPQLVPSLAFAQPAMCACALEL